MNLPEYKIVFLLKFFGLCALASLRAQTIQVVDQASLQPIENVFIYNSNTDQSVQTNYDGLATGALFQSTDTLYFRHPAFNEHLISYQDLQRQKFRVGLKEKVISINEIIVSANKWEQDRSEIPNQIVSISPEKIALTNPQTTADVLTQSGQVFVQKSQLGGGSPMIRGFAANSVLIMVDGVRMNNAIFRSGNLQNVISIDPQVLDNVEILFGPGSVIYGSDALGGTMNFITRSPVYSFGKTPLVKGNAAIRYSTANSEKSAHLDFTFSGQKWASLTSFSINDYGDLRSGSKRNSKFPDFGKQLKLVKTINGLDQTVSNPRVNHQTPSGYDQQNLLQKFRFRPGKAIDLTYTFNYSTTSDIPRYDRLIETDDQGNFIASEWFYGPQKWLLQSLKVDIFKQTSWFDKARVILSYQDVKESRNARRFQDDKLQTTTESVDVYGVNVDLEKIINQHQAIFYGLEWIHNDVLSKGISTDIFTGVTAPITARYPDGGSNYTSMASYLNFKWTLKKPITVTGGLRYSKVWLNARLLDQSAIDFPYDELNINNGAINGSLGLTFRPHDTWQLNLLFSNGFRSPNIDDAGKIFDGAGGIVTVPNPDLGPEYSYNVEVGLSKTWGAKVKISANLFYSYLNDAIVRRDFLFNGQDSILFDGEFSRVKSLINAGYANIYGFSTELKIAFSESLIFHSNFSYIEGSDQDDQPLRHTTPFFGSTSLKYEKGKLQASLIMRYNGKRAFSDLPETEKEKSYLYTPDGSLAWSTLNLSAAYQVHPRLQVSTGVENILDLHYRPYSSGISAPGRNFIISLKGNF